MFARICMLSFVLHAAYRVVLLPSMSKIVSPIVERSFSPFRRYKGTHICTQKTPI